MRRLAFLALILSLAAPAAAGIAPRRDYPDVGKRDPIGGSSILPGPGHHRDTRDIRKRVDRARENGDISRREARRLKREARWIDTLGHVYERDGLSESEARELDARALYLRGIVTRPRPPQ